MSCFEVSHIADLERALQTRWDRETLAVYADCLQAAGDPRGELIAIDLHIETNGATSALEARRREQLHAWLGGDCLHDRPWHPELFQFGLLDDFYIASHARTSATDYASAFLASPASGYTRGIKIAGEERVITTVLELLARRQHPWLEYLAIEQTAVGHRPAPRALVKAMLAAAPQLHTLELDGRYVLEGDAIASMHRLELRGADVIDLDGPLDGVEELDLALDVQASIDTSWPHRLLARLPNLRVLDLARNEPATGDRDVFAMLPSLKAARFERIRLPSPRHAQHREFIRALAAPAPALAIDIARCYRAFSHLLAPTDHPRLSLPEPRPWPPPDTLTARDLVLVSLPDDRDLFARRTAATARIELVLADCVTLLEDDFDTMPDDARRAWTLFWQFLDSRQTQFPAATLARALVGLDDIDLATGGFGPWRMLGEQLRALDLDPDATARIIRYRL